MIEKVDEQVGWSAQDTWSGKTFQEHSQVENQKAQTLQPSSKKLSKSVNQTPLCQCVCRMMDGQNPGAITLTMEPGALLGEFTMLGFGESPREESASHLLQILEDYPHQKYSLSARACQGILSRAKRRGKKLPESLEIALIHQSGA